MSSFGIDMVVLAGFEAGVEVRLPYLDLRLIELVLGLPWNYRLPQGDVRRLQRDGARPFLPPEILLRTWKAGFNRMAAHQVSQNLVRIETILTDPGWLSTPYVNQAAVLRKLAVLLREDASFLGAPGWKDILKIVAFEAWMRRLFG